MFNHFYSCTKEVKLFPLVINLKPNYQYFFCVVNNFSQILFYNAVLNIRRETSLSCFRTSHPSSFQSAMKQLFISVISVCSDFMQSILRKNAIRYFSVMHDYHYVSVPLFHQILSLLFIYLSIFNQCIAFFFFKKVIFCSYQMSDGENDNGEEIF